MGRFVFKAQRAFVYSMLSFYVVLFNIAFWYGGYYIPLLVVGVTFVALAYFFGFDKVVIDDGIVYEYSPRAYQLLDLRDVAYIVEKYEYRTVINIENNGVVKKKVHMRTIEFYTAKNHRVGMFSSKYVRRNYKRFIAAVHATNPSIKVTLYM